jgi:1-acyl-sn-glycerol-3-phosphate acyltransferase
MPQPCVFVGNHTSYLDIVLSTFYIDHLALYMGKAELLKAPLFKTFFKGMDITVNRKSIKDSHRAFMKAGEEIDKGRSMVNQLPATQKCGVRNRERSIAEETK